MNRTVIATLLAALPALAGAQPQAPAEPGDATRAWLELQKSNNASWGERRELPAEVAERIWQRYLKSFEHPIPERFTVERDSE